MNNINIKLIYELVVLQLTANTLELFMYRIDTNVKV